MRTTVTLDADVEKLLRDAQHRRGTSFKQALNDAVRRGLRPKSGDPDQPEYQVEARPMRLREGIDPACLHDLEDDLEVDRFLTTTRKLKGEAG